MSGSLVSAQRVRVAAVSDRPLDEPELLAAVRDRSAGAEAIFRGVVRDHDHGRGVVRLEYVAHPSAARVLAGIAGHTAGQPDVLALVVAHRIGVLEVGDTALLVAVATAHRGRAFELCARLVEQLKAELPIWKRQVFTDGSDEWVNCP